MDGPSRHGVDSPEAARRLLAQLADLFVSPGLHPVTLDLDQGTVGFVPVDRPAYRALSFHNVAALRTATPEAIHLPLSGLLRRFERAGPASDPVHFILHHAFSGSTLLSRALEATTPTLALREPDVLHQVLKATAEASGGADRRPAPDRVLRLVLHLLARHHPDQVATVVKASDSPSMALEALLVARPESRGVFLYLAPEAFVAVAIKSESRRQWLEQRATWFERGLLRLPVQGGWTSRDASPGRVAVALWVAHAAAARSVAAHLGPGRLRTLATDALLDDPQTAVEAVARFFQLPVAGDVAASLVPILGRHAKLGGPYDARARARELATLRARHAADIDDALTWAKETLGEAALALPLPAPLLD